MSKVVEKTKTFILIKLMCLKQLACYSSACSRRQSKRWKTKVENLWQTMHVFTHIETSNHSFTPSRVFVYFESISFEKKPDEGVKDFLFEIDAIPHVHI